MRTLLQLGHILIVVLLINVLARGRLLLVEVLLVVLQRGALQMSASMSAHQMPIKFITYCRHDKGFSSRHNKRTSQANAVAK